MTARSLPGTGSTSWALAMAAGVPAVALLLLLVRALLAHPVHYDELLHILAARGLLDGGAPTIADGLYERAQLYTRAVALAFRIAGDDPVSARLPALVGAAALVWLLGSWLARRVGFVAGLVGAMLLAILPATLDVAVFARFYTFHAVVVTALFMAVFAACEPVATLRARAAWGAFALLLVPLGWHFQETTVIAVGAAIAAAAVLWLYDHRIAALGVVRRHPVAVAGSLLALAAAGAFALWQLGLVRVFGSTALWAARDAGRYQFYLVELRRELPLLLPLLPVCAWVGLVSEAYRRIVLFAVVIVVAALLVHSVAAQKTMRYIYYVAPWMCVIWAAGVARMLEWARGLGIGRVPPLMSLAAVALLSQEGVRTANLLAGRIASLDSRPFAEEPDWTDAVPMLERPAREAARVITSNSMKALYYLGRYDLELNATIVPETDRGVEFGRDERTGRRAISLPESVERALSEPGDSLVVLESEKIGRSSGVPPAAFEVVRSRCSELQVPDMARLRAWHCPPRS